jgi:hypothetical protein
MRSEMMTHASLKRRDLSREIPGPRLLYFDDLRAKVTQNLCAVRTGDNMTDIDYLKSR